jgi:3-isopropylmalate/(R)-2-methylmalate dehydratase small subunit
MIREMRGKVLRIGDNIDTDQIYPARYIELTDEQEMAQHALEGVDSSLPGQLSEFSILVAGRNLGCGSSREHAPRSLRAAGIKALVAESFARIFFRNAVNLGLPAIHLSSTQEISTNDELTIRPGDGVLVNETRDLRLSFPEFSVQVMDILNAGGLVEYFRQRSTT